MIAGADVDARTQLLPDVVTVGAAALGIIAAAFLSVDNPWENVASAILRAGVGALALQSLRIAHMRLRGIEGLGFGDVKLTAAIGAWLRLELIPVCFVLATTAALLFLVIRRSGRPIGQEKLPLGAFLCPSLWLVFFVDALPG
jgi:leader peptidase (prepilin peptidase)/N-methyltransferase